MVRALNCTMHGARPWPAPQVDDSMVFTMTSFTSRLRPAAAAATLALAGCASFSPDGGTGRVTELTHQRTGQKVSVLRSPADGDAAAGRVAELLQQPLSAERAVQVALLNHRGLQARLAALGIAEADRVRAGRLPNPALRFGRVTGGGATEIDRSITVSLLGLLTLPAASDMATAQFEQAQLQAALDVLATAAQARKAFYAAVASQQLLSYQEQVKEAADASSELAQRMLKAGNFNKLAQLREQAFQADATAGLARARHQAVADRERLTRALGLTGAQLAFTLPERLPDLPASPIEPRDAERTALDTRLDVLMARRDAQAAARALGLTQATRFVNVLDLGVANKSATGERTKAGYEIELELPLFDLGATRSARAQALYMQAVHHTAQVAGDAQSEVREAVSAYRTAYELARHYRDEVVPLRKRISDEQLLRYNGMLASVFELLADAHEQIAAVTAAVQALRDHWLAEAELQDALTAQSPNRATAGLPATE